MDSSAHTAERVRVSDGEDKMNNSGQPLCPNCAYPTQYLWCGANTQCRTCGWEEQEQLGQEIQRLDLLYIYGDMDRGAELYQDCGWTVGLVRKEQPSIALVKMHRLKGGPGDKFNFTDMARAKGVNLGDA